MSCVYIHTYVVLLVAAFEGFADADPESSKELSRAYRVLYGTYNKYTVTVVLK